MRMLAAVMTIVGCVSVANGMTWNVATDWNNLEENPNGAWSYGLQLTLDDPLILYDFPEALEGGQWQWWHSFSVGDVYTPGLGQNVGPGYIVGYVPEGKVVAHPGPGADGGVPGNDIKGEYSTLRWTAPADGLYDVSVLFEGIANTFFANQHTTTDVHVQINGVSAFSGIIDGYIGGVPEEPDPTGDLPTQYYRQIVDLAAGDTVDFAVGDGENLSYYSDMTGITAVINLVENLPGDFNLNGTVDAADYTVWRDTGGTPEQYNEWRANFGTSLPPATAAVAVPEPTASLLVAVLCVSLAAYGTRFR